MKNKLSGSIAVQNTAPNGDNLVVSKISIVGSGGIWLSYIGTFKAGGYSIPKGKEHLSLQGVRGLSMVRSLVCILLLLSFHITL